QPPPNSVQPALQVYKTRPASTGHVHRRFNYELMLRKQDQENSLDTKLMRGKQVVHCRRPNLGAKRMECGESRYCWQTPPAPEARRTLAGGGAKRNHRNRAVSESRPEGAQEKCRFANKSESGVPAGTRKIFYDRSRWFHHRLSSVAPPGRKITSRSLPAV